MFLSLIVNLTNINVFISLTVSFTDISVFLRAVLSCPLHVQRVDLALHTLLVGVTVRRGGVPVAPGRHGRAVVGSPLEGSLHDALVQVDPHVQVSVIERGAE